MNFTFIGDICECPSPFQASLLQSDSLLPLVITPDQADVCFSSLSKWLTANKNWLEKILLKHGGILFRGFPIPDAVAFEEFIQALKLEMFVYRGHSPRPKVHNQIYVSTELPSQYSISLHNELVNTGNPPRKIFFFCQVPASEGGETPIVDSRKVYQLMEPELRARFTSKQVCYTQNMPNGKDMGILGKSWQTLFETSDRTVVENYLTEANIEFDWQPDGSLKTRLIGPAAINHPQTAEPAWHAQAHTLHYSSFGVALEAMRRLVGEENLPVNTFYGDGTSLDPADVQAISKLHFNHAILFPWQHGDVLMLDNLLTAHGRQPFKGERRVLVAMTN